MKRPHDGEDRKVYDLDGTLSYLNNTYDFIHGYLLSESKHARYAVSRIMSGIIHRLPGNFSFWRRLVIQVMFKGLDSDELDDYFQRVYVKRFLETLTPLGIQVKNAAAENSLLLTGCTEVPAKQIAGVLGIKEVVSTEFAKKGSRITGISQDTYGDLKAGVFKRIPGQTHTYYTDDADSERSVLRLMDKVVVVNYRGQ